MSRAIEDLKNEHQAVLQILAIMEKMVSLIQMGTDPSGKDIIGVLDFLKEFADKCHHGKEEGILFPELKKTGAPETEGPIRVLLSEHTTGRSLIRKMDECFPDVSDHEVFTQTAIQYIVLLKNHIQKEDHILFPMAEKLISPLDMNRIFQKFEEHEEKGVGQGRHEQLHELLKTWKSTYLE